MNPGGCASPTARSQIRYMRCTWVSPGRVPGTVDGRPGSGTPCADVRGLWEGDAVERSDTTVRRVRAGLCGALLAVACAVLPVAAAAAPVQYDFTSGSASVTATILDFGDVASVALPLSGTFVTFDEAVPELTDFEFAVTSSSIMLTSPFQGYDEIVLAATLTPAPGYVNHGTTGPNPYSFDVGPVVVTGSLHAYDHDGIEADLDIPLFQLENDPLTGTVDIAMGMLTLEGVTFAILDVDGGQLQITGDIVFEGVAVSEPTANLLLAAGLGGLLVAGSRHRRAARR